jgi:hypothetical protein
VKKAEDYNSFEVKRGASSSGNVYFFLLIVKRFLTCFGSHFCRIDEARRASEVDTSAIFP